MPVSTMFPCQHSKKQDEDCANRDVNKSTYSSSQRIVQIRSHRLCMMMTSGVALFVLHVAMMKRRDKHHGISSGGVETESVGTNCQETALACNPETTAEDRSNSTERPTTEPRITKREELAHA